MAKKTLSKSGFGSISHSIGRVQALPNAGLSLRLSRKAALCVPFVTLIRSAAGSRKRVVLCYRLGDLANSSRPIEPQVSASSHVGALSILGNLLSDVDHGLPNIALLCDGGPYLLFAAFVLGRVSISLSLFGAAGRTCVATEIGSCSAENKCRARGG